MYIIIYFRALQISQYMIMQYKKVFVSLMNSSNFHRWKKNVRGKKRVNVFLRERKRERDNRITGARARMHSQRCNASIGKLKNHRAI